MRDGWRDGCPLLSSSKPSDTDTTSLLSKMSSELGDLIIQQEFISIGTVQCLCKYVAEESSSGRIMGDGWGGGGCKKEW